MCIHFLADPVYKVYKDKLQNCSCNQFHYIGNKRVEKSSMTKNSGGNNGSEKWIEKDTAATDRLIEEVHGSYAPTYSGLYIFPDTLWWLRIFMILLSHSWQGLGP